MTSQDLYKILEKWCLESDAHELLYRTARRIMKQIINKRLDLTLFGHPADAADEKLIDDFISELTLFILDNKKILKILMENEDQSFDAGSFLVSRFIKNIIDKARCPGKDPKRYLHHRIYEVLRDSDQFFLSTDDDKHSMFSMDEKSKKLYGLTSEDFQRIDFPFHIVNIQTFENISKKEQIIKLARYFWESIAGLLNNRPVFIHTRDFVNWIEFYIEFQKIKAVDDESAVNHIADSRISQDKEFDLKKWALLFINHMDEKEKTVFYFHHCLEMKYKTVSVKLGYSSPSGSKYCFDKALEKMKRFIMENDLPYLSSHDLDEDCFSFFLNFLCENLNKSVSKP